MGVAEKAPDPLTAKPPRIAFDETMVTTNAERYWLYAAIGLETQLLLDVWISP